jgi:hypothetical protein
MTDADAVFWLRVMAIASALQVAILFAAVLAAVVLIRRAQARLGEWQRQHIAPVTARAYEAIDAVHDMAQRFRAIDDDVRRTVGRAGQRLHHTRARVRAPFAGFVRGAGAAIATLAFGRLKKRAARTNGPLDAQDLEDRERFTSEGGSQHARQ